MRAKLRAPADQDLIWINLALRGHAAPVPFSRASASTPCHARFPSHDPADLASDPRPRRCPHDAVKVLLLGAGELGKEVVIALQRLGRGSHRRRPLRRTLPHTRSRTAPMCSNMADPAALRALIESVRPAIVVPEIEAIATEALADDRTRRPRARRPDRARRPADDEPRRHPPPRGGAVGAADVAVSLRQFAGGTARGRCSADRPAVRRQAGDVLVGQGPEQDRARPKHRARRGTTPTPADAWRSDA